MPIKTLIKIYDFFRYDIPQGVHNLIRFFPVIWKFRSWDYIYALIVFKKCLEFLSKSIENGYEVDESRLPKADAINKAVVLLNNIIEGNEFELAEQELKMKLSNLPFEFVPCKHDKHLAELKDNRTEEMLKNDKQIYDKSYEIEERQWKELKDILFGNENIPESDMRGWWD